MRLDRLYDEAAVLVQDGGLDWDGYWSMPSNRLERYKAACRRKSEREQRQSERR